MVRSSNCWMRCSYWLSHLPSRWSLPQQLPCPTSTLPRLRQQTIAIRHFSCRRAQDGQDPHIWCSASRVFWLGRGSGLHPCSRSPTRRRDELCERLAAQNPRAAAAMWIGISMHSAWISCAVSTTSSDFLPSPRLIDRSEGIELLEDELPRLSLRHFQDLWDPALDLSDMLSAISRAKDEVSPMPWLPGIGRGYGTELRYGCRGDEERREVHGSCLGLRDLRAPDDGGSQLVDFGDLVAQPVRLVETDSG